MNFFFSKIFYIQDGRPEICKVRHVNLQQFHEISPSPLFSQPLTTTYLHQPPFRTQLYTSLFTSTSKSLKILTKSEALKFSVTALHQCPDHECEGPKLNLHIQRPAAPVLYKLLLSHLGDKNTNFYLPGSIGSTKQDSKAIDWCIKHKETKYCSIQKIFSGGGGWRVQIPRRGLTKNFNMAKIINLAIPGGGSGPPVPPSGSAHEFKAIELVVPVEFNM